ncbi:hypothetical protein GCM10010251_38720 [Streptomyces aurantiogriseus]|uniref:Uncharacterized protein n=1 Tax=Streptomyces aurantiogriseus TaxID=66870 RepID=A0A918CF34_9ACTN|nr:hypothetical protein GCM10010251_38720 [Streptomyces aurantiogriseus]
MPEPLLDHLDVGLAEERRRGGQVPRVVQADRWKPGQLHEPVEPSADPVGVQGLAVLTGPNSVALDPGPNARGMGTGYRGTAGVRSAPGCVRRVADMGAAVPDEACPETNPVPGTA